MARDRLRIAATAFFAALLFTAGLADDGSDSALKPVDLKKDAYDVTLQALPSGRGVLMEFYAAWCPACKHFQPHYDKVAAYFYGTPRPKPEVYVARVDCATEGALCTQYNIGHYPTLKFGRPADYEVGKGGKLEEYSGARTEKEIIEWVGKLQSTAYDFDPNREAQAFQQAAPVAQKEVDAPKAPQRVDLNDIESSTILSFRYIVEMGDGLSGLEKRQALKDWLDLLSRSHPLSRCAQGAKNALESLPKIWPPEAPGASAAALGQIKICGDGVSLKEWGSCRGSRETSRGYTCGLWLLLHSLAARSAPPETVGAFWMTAVKQFVEQFFQCSECSQHFGTMAAEEAAAAVTTKRDAVLWAWRAHNVVNKRVADEEFKDHSGDPFFPKVQWPPPELCPLCRAPSVTAGATAGKASSEAEPEWNEDEVYRFLVRYYGDAGEKADAASVAYFGGRKGLSGKVDKARRHGYTIAKFGGIALVALAVYVLAHSAGSGGRKSASIL